jgi:hypothetical protein
MNSAGERYIIHEPIFAPLLPPHRRIVVDDEDNRVGFDHGTLASPTGSVN